MILFVKIKNPALYESDYERSGFDWIDCQNEKLVVYSFLRKSKGQKILAVFNFSDKDVSEYKVQLTAAHKANLILNSDWECYGGTIPQKKNTITIKQTVMEIDIKKFSAVFFEIK